MNSLSFFASFSISSWWLFWFFLGSPTISRSRFLPPPVQYIKNIFTSLVHLFYLKTFINIIKDKIKGSFFFIFNIRLFGVKINSSNNRFLILIFLFVYIEIWFFNEYLFILCFERFHTFFILNLFLHTFFILHLRNIRIRILYVRFCKIFWNSIFIFILRFMLFCFWITL